MRHCRGICLLNGGKHGVGLLAPMSRPWGAPSKDERIFYGRANGLVGYSDLAAYPCMDDLSRPDSV